MEPKLVFWSASFANMTAIVAFALYGRALARRGRMAAHRRAMHAAAFLVLAFVAAYVLKVVFLGKEDLATWSAGLRATLYVHETFIAVMLLAGIIARTLSRRALAARATARPSAPFRWHRILGRVALAAAIAGLVTGGLLLAGMWQLEPAPHLVAAPLP